MVENDSADERIGHQVALLRGHRDVSQTALAEAMKARGHQKWSQSTVWAVEKGTRPLRLTEAIDLAWVLGGLVDDLVDPLDGRARYEQGVRRARVELEAMEAMIAERIDRLTDDWLGEVEEDERRGTEGQEVPGG